MLYGFSPLFFPQRLQLGDLITASRPNVPIGHDLKEEAEVDLKLLSHGQDSI